MSLIFSRLVKLNFNFLKTQFGFDYLKSGIGYIKEDLELEFYIGNGQVDIIFFVRKDNKIFRPYISRSFELMCILRLVKKSKLEPYPSEIDRYLIDSTSMDLHLKYYARLMKQHGTDILKGDLSVFEQVHSLRKDNARWQ